MKQSARGMATGQLAPRPASRITSNGNGKSGLFGTTGQLGTSSDEGTNGLTVMGAELLASHQPDVEALIRDLESA